MLKKIKNFFGGAGDEPTDQPEQSSASAAGDESSNAGKKVTDLAGIKAVLKPINWSHVFERTSGEKVDALKDLTDLSNATAGSYPLGISGLWHGGVHFDSGTAEEFKQTNVRCLADGEVVAYRVDKQPPTTSYKVNGVKKDHLFSRSFVLVQHTLVPPEIKGKETPKFLLFYSLYMHLQSWADYESDPAMPRPDFWSEKKSYSVPVTAKDTSDKLPGQHGLKVFYCQDGSGKSHDLLPRGAQVTISGEGEYRKLEGTPGPLYLQDPSAKGSLLGYVQFSGLKKIDGDEYSVEKNLSVYAEATSKSKPIGAKLPAGTELKISGSGDFVKLERVNQYVHFKSLQSQGQPQHFDKVVVLKEFQTIEAGALIGHMGQYQDFGAAQPEKRLHLEVFSSDNVEKFIRDCEDWAKKLPDTSKTWLKLDKGTPVVAHQDQFSTKQPPTLNGPNSKSGANLLVPKSLLDGLSAEKKITVPATNGGSALNWYRIDNLLNDDKNNLLKGWVCEKVGVTTWVSPWAWDGYDVITDYTEPQSLLASVLQFLNIRQRHTYARLADKADAGEMKSRLYDIIARNRDQKLSGEELQAAIKMPAHAQSISQLIICCPSEWYYNAKSWDDLDEMLGDSGSTPHGNWWAEKERIKQLSWWDEVAGTLGLPEDGKVYHFHPLGLLGNFLVSNDDNDLKWLIVPRGQITFDAEGNDFDGNQFFSRVVHRPPGGSGITIGRGYDLGYKKDPRKDLMEVGVGEPLLSWLVDAKGLTHERANNYFLSASQEIRGFKISRKQQYELFLKVYDQFTLRVIDISDDEDNIKYGALNWDSVDVRIQDIIVDLIYRGDYIPTTRKFIQAPFVKNDLEGVRLEISKQENWMRVPRERFRRRVEYLK